MENPLFCGRKKMIQILFSLTESKQEYKIKAGIRGGDASVSSAKKEFLIKACIALVLIAMVALCIANPNEGAETGPDCITDGQVVIIEDEMPPLAATVSKTTTKTSIKKHTEKKKLKKKAKKSKTKTKKKTKRSSSTKKSGSKTIKTQKTVVTTTKTITRKKSRIQKIQTTVKTTTKTTTITQTTSTVGGEVKIRDIAPKIKGEILTAFEDGGYKVIVNPKVSYSGVFRSATKTIELKSANSVIYHEMGHFVSFQTGRADSTEEFKDIYKDEKNAYTASNKAYATQSAGEYFAESFKNYTENPSKLKKERPRTYEYVKEKVDEF